MRKASTAMPIDGNDDIGPDDPAPEFRPYLTDAFSAHVGEQEQEHRKDRGYNVGGEIGALDGIVEEELVDRRLEDGQRQRKQPEGPGRNVEFVEGPAENGVVSFKLAVAAVELALGVPVDIRARPVIDLQRQKFVLALVQKLHIFRMVFLPGAQPTRQVFLRVACCPPTHCPGCHAVTRPKQTVA